MFDIGFAELLIIAVISLLVLGPERLPGAIRSVSLWIGHLRQGFNAIKREIEQEVGMDEIRQQIHNDSIMESLKETNDSLKSTTESVKEELSSLQSDLDINQQTDATSATETTDKPE
jgi:sec-independent protein translocase protein TatB